MKKKYYIFFLVLVCLFVFVSFGIFKVVTNIKKDQEMAQKQSETIRISYEAFNNLASIFNEKNKEFQIEIVEVYYETLEKKESYLREQLDILLNTQVLMQKEYENVKEICKVKYEDSKVNSYCESMKVSVDSAFKLTENGVQLYNSLVEKYNAWQEENSKHKKISTYQMFLEER